MSRNCTGGPPVGGAAVTLCVERTSLRRNSRRLSCKSPRDRQADSALDSTVDRGADKARAAYMSDDVEEGDAVTVDGHQALAGHANVVHLRHKEEGGAE